MWVWDRHFLGCGTFCGIGKPEVWDRWLLSACFRGSFFYSLPSSVVPLRMIGNQKSWWMIKSQLQFCLFLPTKICKEEEKIIPLLFQFPLSFFHSSCCFNLIAPYLQENALYFGWQCWFRRTDWRSTLWPSLLLFLTISLPCPHSSPLECECFTNFIHNMFSRLG